MKAHRFGGGLVAAIAFGGAAGTVARAGVEQAWRTGTTGFPWATFVVNLGGSFLLGLLVAGLERSAPSRYPRALLGTGFCGGFTTYSTFSVETDSLVRAGRSGIAVVYAIVSTAGGLLAFLVGARLARFRTREV